MLADLTRKKWLIRTLILVGVLVILLAGLLIFRNYQKRQKDPYTIGFIYSSKEISPRELELTKFIIGKKLESINQSGGIKNHMVKILYIDDKSDMKALYRMVEKASQDENLIAFVGCRGALRARTLGPILTRKNIPLISQYVFTQLVQRYPTIYSSSVGSNEYKLLLKQLMFAKHSRIGFLGQVNIPTSSELTLKLIEEIISEEPGKSLSVKRIFPKNYDFNSGNFKNFTDSLKKHVDFLVVNIDIKKWNNLLSALEKGKIKIPMFTGSADLAKLDQTTSGFHSAELYSINSIGIPGTQNTNLNDYLLIYSKERDFSKFSPFQISESARIADEIGLIADAAPKHSLTGTKNIRELINTGLLKYINGKRIYQGWLTDWYFNPDHSYGGHTLLAWKPKDDVLPVLASTQYIRTSNDLFAAPVFYTSLNMEQISQVNEEEETFFASFYLELNALKAFDLKQIDFANAVRNEIDHKPLIDAKLIRSEKDSLHHKFYHQFYKISGRFKFEPNLKNYPLDEQKFFITLQANNAWQPFLAQPSVQEKQDSVLESKGWIYKEQYVGYEQDIIITPNAFGRHRQNIPHYKFTYAYILKRSHIDFFLKTLVPLLAILITAYFSVYIPAWEFEALAGIQVTALLSSIALYFATYKPQMPYATISDKIFIFTYVMVTTLIGTSIFIYIFHRKPGTLKSIVQFYQRVIFPIVVIGFTIYIRWF